MLPLYRKTYSHQSCAWGSTSLEPLACEEALHSSGKGSEPQENARGGLDWRLLYRLLSHQIKRALTTCPTCARKDQR